MRTLLLSLLVLSIGCSQGHKLVPVEGTVTLNGEPLSGASVAFQPRSKGDPTDTGPTSTGKTDEQGHFSLRVNTSDEAGAVVGEHIIWISAGKAVGEVDAGQYVEQVPTKYMDGSLRFVVPEGGSESADFDL